ncbi:MAG: response regulator [bacterium]|nr:response regulator [bacterium]
MRTNTINPGTSVPPVKYPAVLCRFLLFFFILSSPLFPLDPNKAVSQYNIQVWNMESGLPGNAVYAIHQTHDGYLWLGTGDGLVRFDGFQFTVFNRVNTPQLKDNVIRALHQGRDRTLWIGTGSGGLTGYKEGRFSTYPVEEHNAFSKIYAINEDRRGNLWVGSFTGGLTQLNPTTGKFTTYTVNEGLPHNQVRAIHKDRNGDLRIVTSGGAVKLLNPGEFQVLAAPDLLPALNTAVLFLPDKNELWIGTGGQGLVRMKDRQFNTYGPGAGLPHPIVNTLYEDSGKNLWIGTDGGGLTRMRNNKFSTLSTGNGLADGSVYSIHEDKEGSLWVGTIEGGLHQLRNSKFTTFTSRDGLVHDYVNCIYEDRDGDLLIGTNGGLDCLKKGASHIEAIRLTTRNGLLNNVVTCLDQDPTGTLWIGTLGGLHLLQNGKLTTFTTGNGLTGNRVWCILYHPPGETWVGTENGLNRFSRKNGALALTTYTTRQGLAGNSVKLLFRDSGGVTWIGTDAGLNRFKDGVFTAYNPAAGIGANHLKCIYEDKENVLWFGTDNGLLQWREKDSRFHAFTTQNGLAENYVYSILEDENDYLWLGGRNGISRVLKKELIAIADGKKQLLQPVIYNKRDGMESGWCTAPGYKTRDGRFWFPTSAGVSMIDPNRIDPNPIPPPIHIHTLKVNGEPLHIRQSEIDETPVRLEPGKKRLEFYYTAPSFINPQRIQFKYRLKGYDSDWIDKGNLRTATYTGLSPGDYTFEVMASNADGVWNTQTASVSFYLRPYFYQTTWFYLLVLLVGLAAVFLIHHLKVRQLRARKQELEQLVHFRTRDLEERNIELGSAKEVIEAKNRKLEVQSDKLKELDQAKSRFFANISHEFRTPLTLIKGPLEQVLAENPDKKQEARATMMLQNTNRLLSLVEQLLELAKFDSGIMKLQVARQNVVPFVKNIVMLFESLAQQNEIQLAFNAETDDMLLYFDPEKIERIIFNLLSNAFNHTPANGEIRVSIRKVIGTAYPSGCTEILVHDTGTGIPSDQLPHIFDRFYRGDSGHEYRHKGTGIGLALARELVELHHGEIEVHSSSQPGHNRGTEFILRLPMGNAHLQAEEIVEVENKNNKKLLQEAQEGGFLEKSPPGRRRQSNKDEPGKKGKPLILVVDDNHGVRTYVRGILEEHFNIKEAENGKQGFDKAVEIIPHLVISDVMMPEMDGYELCAQLKKDIRTSHIPVILLTAKASETNIVEGLETGADDYIIKPFNAPILVTRVKNLIRLRRQLQQKIQEDMILQPGEISVSSLDREFIKELQAIIEENLGDPEFNMEQLAKSLYISHSTLYKKVEALTGQSPQLFTRSYRLKRAAQLLKADFGNVTEVAFEVGFSNTSYFTKCFKEKFHCLPSEYRASTSGQEN